MSIDSSPLFKRNDVFTYRRMRRAIGYLGISLPFLLIGLSLIDFFDTAIQLTISHYYYTNLREILTGTLAAVGFFLIKYKGHGNPSFWKNDQILTNIAGIMALGVALVPVNPDINDEKIYSLIPFTYSWLGYIHYGFAAVLFSTFSLLSINVFTIGQRRDKDLPVSTINENNIYRFCGISILIFMILIPVLETFHFFKFSTLILEALILIFFGVAWLIKGRVLGDEGKIGEKLYSECNTEDTETLKKEIIE